MTVPTKKARRRFRIWRCALACGHTAFNLFHEAHRAGLVSFCHACDRYARIISADEHQAATA